MYFCAFFFVPPSLHHPSSSSSSLSLLIWSYGGVASLPSPQTTMPSPETIYTRWQSKSCTKAGVTHYSTIEYRHNTGHIHTHIQHKTPLPYVLYFQNAGRRTMMHQELSQARHHASCIINSNTKTKTKGLLLSYTHTYLAT